MREHEAQLSGIIARLALRPDASRAHATLSRIRVDGDAAIVMGDLRALAPELRESAAEVVAPRLARALIRLCELGEGVAADEAQLREHLAFLDAQS